MSVREKRKEAKKGRGDGKDGRLDRARELQLDVFVWEEVELCLRQEDLQGQVESWESKVGGEVLRVVSLDLLFV